MQFNFSKNILNKMYIYHTLSLKYNLPYSKHKLKKSSFLSNNNGVIWVKNRNRKKEKWKYLVRDKKQSLMSTQNWNYQIIFLPREI